MRLQGTRTETERGPSHGFSLLEVLIASVVLVLAAMAAVLYIGRSAQHSDWIQDRVFAEQKALAILAEMRGYVLNQDGNVASDLTKFDDGSGFNPVLTILADPDDPTELVDPDHPVSGNFREQGIWRWTRQVTVEAFGEEEETLDKRLCTIRIYRRVPMEQAPGTKMAEISGLIQTASIPDATTQVYDLYVLALENHPGWGIAADARRSMLEGALIALRLQHPGMEYRVHWITKAGFGRNEAYAPYTNDDRLSTDTTKWTYAYPGKLPDTGGVLGARYYDARQMGGRLNLDGVDAPAFVNDHSDPEPFIDSNGNGEYDDGEVITDVNGNGTWDPGNTVPYALADMHNHCMRWPDAAAKADARVAAGIDAADEPTWRLLLDQMASDPDRFHNALIINLHGGLLPMPPVRNYSDACRDPGNAPGWRAVTHPEVLAPTRVAGFDATSISPRFRVYAYKTEYLDTQVLTAQEEPYLDTNGNGVFDATETYQDWNGNGVRDLGTPITLTIAGGDFATQVNAVSNPTLIVKRLPGGIDSDASGTAEEYQDWSNPPVYPEAYQDVNANNLREQAETWLDLDGDGVRDPFEPYREIDGNGTFTSTSESLTDTNGNGRWDPAKPAEPFTDANGNGRWDAAEAYWDRDGNGQWTPPTDPETPWQAWDPDDYGDSEDTDEYIEEYGEPFLDADGDGVYDPAESFFDSNANGVCDGGFARGEMWCKVTYDAANNRTVVELHGTPLETPSSLSGRGLPAGERLYDLDYIPCPTPSSAADTDRFRRDLYEVGAFPKNTARWTVEVPTWAIREVLESAAGALDGDAIDRIVAVETRFGRDLTTGRMWPTANAPGNKSTTYAYFYANAQNIPFSERYQFLGDPRHCPYADLDRIAVAFPHGYNWFFDDFRTSGNAQSKWLAFDPARLNARWMGRSDADVPRFLSWLRAALTNSEAFFGSLHGASFSYLSLGGDVSLSTTGIYGGVPMHGRPFGVSGTVDENTLLETGTATVRGSKKYARSNAGTNTSIRAGGYWWAKPWIGELHPDGDYAGQWAPWGNLRARTGTSSDYRMVRRDALPSAQQPDGTLLGRARNTLAYDGAAAFFNAGTAGSTFHHRAADATGITVLDGIEIDSRFKLELPVPLTIQDPFQIDWSGDGSVGPEFAFPSDYPRHTIDLGARLLAESTGPSAALGLAVVRLQAPGSNRAARVVPSGIDSAAGSSLMHGELGLVSLLHGFMAEGLPATPRRVVQLPRVHVLKPPPDRTFTGPSTIRLEWETRWEGWDGEKYTESYADGFSESDTDLVYVPLYSEDGGKTWKNLLDGSAAEPGVMPMAGAVPDPLRTLIDNNAGGNESWNWSTPASSVPAGSYAVRVEGHRRSEAMHYAYQETTIRVER